MTQNSFWTRQFQCAAVRIQVLRRNIKSFYAALSLCFQSAYLLTALPSVGMHASTDSLPETKTVAEGNQGHPKIVCNRKKHMKRSHRERENKRKNSKQTHPAWTVTQKGKIQLPEHLEKKIFWTAIDKFKELSKKGPVCGLPKPVWSHLSVFQPVGGKPGGWMTVS